MEYKISPQKLNKLKKKRLAYYFGFMTLIFGWSFTSAQVRTDIGNSSLIANIICCSITLLIVGFGAYRVGQNLINEWYLYRLKVYDDTILRELAGKPIIQIKISEIIFIQAKFNGDLLIYTNNKALLIPSIIEEIQELTDHLKKTGFTITNKPATFLQKNRDILLAIYGVLVFFSLVIANKIFTAIDGAIVIVLPLIFLIRIFKYPAQNKLKGILFLLIVIIALSLNIYFKLK